MAKTKRKKRPSDKILRRDYWTVDQLAKMTGASEFQIHRNMMKDKIDHVVDNGEYYISQKAFREWVVQHPHFPIESEEIISERIRISFSVTEIAQLLNVNRKTAEHILTSTDGKRLLKTFWVANQIRITKISFFQWLAESSRPGLYENGCPENSPDLNNLGRYINYKQAAYLAGLSVESIGCLTRQGAFPSLRVSARTVRIPLESFIPWVYRRDQRRQLNRSKKSRRKHT